MLSPLQALCTLALATICYILALAIHRLHIHPLAHFPGPKLAAATKWYEFWYDIIVPPGGQYSAIINRLHDKYGDVVRINPDELHIRDPDMYEHVYASSVKRDKWYNAARMTGKEHGSFTTIPHELHRRRKVANAPMMMRRRVHANQSILFAETDALVANVQRAAASGEVLDLGVLFIGYALDVVGAYFFDKAIGAQKDAELARNWRQVTKSTARMTPIMKQLPSFAKLVARVPSSVVKSLLPNASVLADLQDQMLTWATEFHSNREGANVLEEEVDPNPRTLFQTIENSKLPESEKGTPRLVDEGIDVIVAGSESTAQVLTRGVVELMLNPDTLVRARQELVCASSLKGECQLSLADLEKLPYLTAVVKESLRITAVVTSRFPVQLHEPFRYNGFEIPAMTPVSLTPASILHDARIFSAPKSFKPERWLEDLTNKEEHHPKLERYFVPFGKGSRMCQGVHIAWAEMYLALAALISGFDFEPGDLVRERDIDFVGDYFVGGVREDSPGVRVKVRKVS